MPAPLSSRLLLLVFGLFGHGTMNSMRLLMSLYAVHLGASPFTVGLLFACYASVAALLAVHVGRWVDRVGLIRPLVLCTLAMAGVMLLNFLQPGLVSMFIAAPVIGIGFTTYNIALNNITGAIGSASERTANYGWLTLGYASGTFSGPLVAGICIDQIGHPATFLVTALFPLGGLLTTLLSRRRIQDVRRQAGGAQGRLGDLLKDPGAMKVLAISALFSSVWDIFIFGVPLYCASIGISATVTGVIMGWHAAASFLVRMAIPVGLNRVPDWILMGVSCCVLGLALALFPMFTDPSALMILSVVAGLGIGLGTPVSLSLAYTVAPPGRQGEFGGVRSMLGSVCHVVVPLGAGVFINLAGMAAVFVASAAVGVASGLWAVRSHRRAETR